MLKVVSIDEDKYGIVDDLDNSLEYVDKDSLKKLHKLNLYIDGINPNKKRLDVKISNSDDIESIMIMDKISKGFSEYVDNDGYAYKLEDNDICLCKIPKNLNNIYIKSFVTSVSEGFCGIKRSLKVSGGSGLKNCDNMFAHSTLYELDISDMDTRKVTSMSHMFYDCKNLYKLILGNIDTSKVFDMSYMFMKSGLISLDLSLFNTSNVTDMNHMFCYCEKLNNLNLGNFDVSNVINMDYMFSNCSNLCSLDLHKFNMVNVKFMAHFLHNTKLSNNFEPMYLNMKQLISLDYAFCYFSHFNKLDLSILKLDYVKNINNAFSYIKDSTEILDLSNTRIKNNVDFGHTFESSNFKIIKLPKITKVTNMDFAFSNCKYLNEVFFNNDNICIESNTLDGLFYHCENIKRIDLSVFDDNLFRRLANTFNGCSRLEYLNMGKIKFEDTYIDLCSLFYYCNNLSVLIFNGLKKVLSYRKEFLISKNNIFKRCTKLKKNIEWANYVKEFSGE